MKRREVRDVARAEAASWVLAALHARDEGEHRCPKMGDGYARCIYWRGHGGEHFESLTTP